MLLEVKNLSKSFGGVEALNKVSFTLSKGEVLGVVGDNGAGKSTLMKSLSGIIKADEGHISFDHENLPLGNPYASRARGIEMIYQDLALCRQQSVLSNMFLGRESRLKIAGLETCFLDHKAMRKKGAEILDELQVDLNLKTEVGSLSGGQQQAVAIARSMVQRPKLMIMDEPTAALGVKEIRNVLSLIKTLKKQGIAVLLISHRLSDIIDTSDRVLVMQHGKICHDTSTKSLTVKELTSLILEE